jgi:hypothetical protein
MRGMWAHVTLSEVCPRQVEVLYCSIQGSLQTGRLLLGSLLPRERPCLRIYHLQAAQFMVHAKLEGPGQVSLPLPDVRLRFPPAPPQHTHTHVRTRMHWGRK